MSTFTALVVCTAMVATLQLVAAGTNYTVTWNLSTDYTKWVSDKTFNPSDNLIFSYSSPHDVWEVSKSDYDTCTIGTPINQYTGGNNVIELTETGSRYFYCSVSNHCSKGMKLAVSVVASNETSSPPSPSTTVSPPPPYGAAAVTGAGSHLAMALALGAMFMIFA